MRRSYHRIRRDIKREDSLEGAEATNLTGQQLTPQQLLIHRENNEQLEKIIGNLPVDYATIIELRGVKELSFAEAMGRSVNAVTKLWQRALVRLAEEMENQG